MADLATTVDHDVDRFDLLVAQGRDVDAFVEAAQKGVVSYVKAGLETIPINATHSVGQLNQVKPTSSRKFTADDFVEAARRGNLDDIQTMLAWGIDRHGTSLWLATVDKGHPDIVRKFLHAGASVSYKDFIPDDKGTFMEWSFEGATCHGLFKPEASVAIFNFCLHDSMVTITYRMLDASTQSLRTSLLSPWCTFCIILEKVHMLSRGLFRAAPLTSALRRNASTAYALPSWAKVNPETLSGASPAEIHNLGTTVFTRSEDPLTGEVFLQVPLTQKDELKPFIDNLRSTPKHGLHNPFKNVERYLLYGDISHKAAAMLREPHIEHYFIRLIQRVAPKSYIQAKNEVVVTRKFLENFSGDQVRFLARSFGVPGDHLGQMSTGHRWPYGPVALITPFNFPFEIPILQLLGALYMGNRVTLKLDSKVAVVMYEALRMFHACGMPLTD
ncbi:hypothetical protein DYB36_006366, partial [Aphanomyces astaci]